MFMSDGTVVDINYQHRASISYSSSSRELAYDVSAALLKFGVFSNITMSNKKKTENEYYDTTYNVTVNGVANCKKFYENIPLFGYKGDRLLRAIESVHEINRMEVENNALFVHKIKSIEHAGKADTYDISVHNLDFEEQNFLAEGMIVHNSLDIEIAKLLGVNIEDLFVSQPDSGNQSLEIAKLLINSGEFAVVVLDSVTALVPEQETTDNFSFGDASVGLHARLMSQACRVLSPLAATKNVALIFTNQIREKIGGMSYDNTTTTGGRALRFYSSQRIELKKIQQVKTDEEVTGHIIKAKVVKNKVARPYRECTYEITYGQNAVRLNEILELGVKYGLISKGGSWYSYGDTKIGQGSAKVKNFLIENKEIADTIETAIKEKLANE
jgi:recombination protein RecA